jgi:hypothetical protein
MNQQRCHPRPEKAKIGKEARIEPIFRAVAFHSLLNIAFTPTFSLSLVPKATQLFPPTEKVV